MNRRISSAPIDYLVVHCADTSDDKDYAAEDIHAWHKANGWDGIGYHAVILRDGAIHPGRPDYWLGAHVKGHNSKSLGVCLIGRSQFPKAQINALAVWLEEKLGMYPDAGVVGHRDFDSGKTCPNFDVARWWSDGAPVDSLEAYQ